MAPLVVGFHGLAFLRGGITAARDDVITFASVVSSVCRDGGNVLIGRDLSQQLGQHGVAPRRGISDARARDLHRLNLQRFRINGPVQRPR